jgi:alginate O-acetyltransferase complex protein AlgI
MLFNSYSFIFLFLPITFAGMFWLGKYSPRLAALWLGLASLTFYAVWDARFVLLLLTSIAFNYGAGYWIGLRRASDVNRQAKYSLIAAIAVNLTLLGYFKYTNFFIASANQFFDAYIPALDIILPLGISFFTFTQIAFLVDVYRGIAREASLIHYLLFVTYFPHLIAGPVLHHKQMMPQFANPATYRINTEHIAIGLTIFVLGLSKKILIADNLAEYATPIFNAASNGQVLMLFEAWIGALAYTLQLYFDFSGYSEMAIGLSLMFNVHLPLNFDSPYKAVNIIDFWRRWHMTLSAFLRDYLYFPLGGNRKGPVRRYANLMATMLLGGLWHGAGWTFIVWGGLHGLYLIINHGWRELKVRLGWGDGGSLARLASGALTFLAVVIAWVFFRADKFTTASSILSSMAGLNGMSLHESMEPRLMPLLMNIPHLSVTFGGFFTATHTDAGAAFSTIGVGLALVWLLPNVRQMLPNYKSIWQGMDRVISQAISSHKLIRPAEPGGFVIGVMFFCIFMLAIVNASRGGASEFIYFNF